MTPHQRGSWCVRHVWHHVGTNRGTVIPSVGLLQLGDMSCRLPMPSQASRLILSTQRGRHLRLFDRDRTLTSLLAPKKKYGQRETSIEPSPTPTLRPSVELLGRGIGSRSAGASL